MPRKLGSFMTPQLSKGQPALQFDGTQNYIDLGLMGGFGAAIGTNNGFYAAFDIKVVAASSNACPLGTLKAGNLNAFRVLLNSGGVSGKTRISLFDSLSKKIDGFFTNIAIMDGGKHTLIITITPSTNTIVATLDGAGQAITYTNQESPATYVNFDKNVFLGAVNNDGAVSNNAAVILDTVKLGTAAGTLFGNYAIDEGTGTTIADTSGQGNTGTLTGTPLPTWVLL
jgi:hypothetical protein